MILVTGGAYQGKKEYAAKEFGNEYEIIGDYHLKVREQLKEGKDIFKEAERLLSENDKIVITSDELGCGIVPVDAFEREYREKNGRINCFLAERAERVIRVICGIGVKIK